MERQIVGLAGEYFVAAELLKRNYQVSMTIGNAKAIDILAKHEKTGRLLQIQVKTLKKKPNCFTLHTEKIETEAFYFFVYLNPEGAEPDYYILKGEEILEDKKHFYGASLGRVDRRETVNHGPLQKHKDKWGKLIMG
jgi:predicted AAA+ superfamily ATPase